MPNILVVDSDQASMHNTSTLLEQARYNVSEVEDGRSALRMIAANPPDLVLLEAQLLDQDGLETCRRIRRTSDVPIIFLSSRAQTDDRILGLQNGADVILVSAAHQLKYWRGYERYLVGQNEHGGLR